MTPDELTALKNQAMASVAELYDEPRLGHAAFKAAEATEHLTREERIVVLLNVLMPTLQFVPAETFIEALSIFAIAQHPMPEVAAAAWVKLARDFGVRITPRPPHA